MPNYNKVTLIGHMTRDPELRYIPSGTAVCEIGLAVNSGWGENKKTAFLTCVAWAKRGEVIAEHHAKGDPILIEGQLTQDTWEDKTTGQKRSKIKVLVDDFVFMKTKGDSPQAAQPQTEQSPPPDDDIPF